MKSITNKDVEKLEVGSIIWPLSTAISSPVMNMKATGSDPWIVVGDGMLKSAGRDGKEKAIAKVSREFALLKVGSGSMPSRRDLKKAKKWLMEAQVHTLIQLVEKKNINQLKFPSDCTQKTLVKAAKQKADVKHGGNHDTVVDKKSGKVITQIPRHDPTPGTCRAIIKKLKKHL